MSENIDTESVTNQDESVGQEYSRYQELSKLLDRDPLLVDINEFNEVFDNFIKSRKLQLRAAIKEEPEIYWVTVNPKPEAQLDLIMKCIHNFCARKAVKDYHYSFEQRGETLSECGKGIHCHILLKWDKRQNKYVKQFLIESCKRIVGSHSSSILNIRRITSNVYQDKLDYLHGKKWDKEKDDKIKIDKIFREKNNIFDIYKNDDAK